MGVGARVGLGFGLEGAVSHHPIPAWVLGARKVDPPVARPPRAGIAACGVVCIPLLLSRRVGIEQAAVRGGVAAWLGLGLGLG